MDVKTLCLAVLSRGPSSGYEIRKTFEDGVFSFLFDASFGAIYPALARLEADGLVDWSEQAQDKRPDKKVYRITPAGRSALPRLLSGVPKRDKLRSETLIKFLFAQVLPPDEVIDAYDRYVAFHRAVLAELDGCDGEQGTMGDRFIHGLGRTVLRAKLDYLERQRAAFLAELAPAEAARPMVAE